MWNIIDANYEYRIIKWIYKRKNGKWILYKKNGKWKIVLQIIDDKMGENNRLKYINIGSY